MDREQEKRRLIMEKVKVWRETRKRKLIEKIYGNTGKRLDISNQVLGVLSPNDSVEFTTSVVLSNKKDSKAHCSRGSSVRQSLVAPRETKLSLQRKELALNKRYSIAPTNFLPSCPFTSQPEKRRVCCRLNFDGASSLRRVAEVSTEEVVNNVHPSASQVRSSNTPLTKKRVLINNSPRFFISPLTNALPPVMEKFEVSLIEPCSKDDEDTQRRSDAKGIFNGSAGTPAMSNVSSKDQKCLENCKEIKEDETLPKSDLTEDPLEDLDTTFTLIKTPANVQTNFIRDDLLEWLEVQEIGIESFPLLIELTYGQEESKKEQSAKSQLWRSPVKCGVDSPCVVEGTTKMHDTLAEFHRLIIKGYPAVKCEKLLFTMKTAWEAVECSPLYWECKSLIDQAFYGSTDHSADKENLVHYQEEVKDLRSKLEKLHLDIPSKMFSTVKCKPHPHVLTESHNIIRSSSLQFKLEEKPYNDDENGNLFVTPVRRSRRLIVKTPKTDIVNSLLDLTPNKKVHVKPNPFLM